MDSLTVWKEQLQEIYSRYSGIINRVGKFALSLVIFLSINHQIGFMHKLANPVFAVGLAVVCAFLPVMLIVAIGMALILVHMLSLSVVVFAVVAVLFLTMFCLYFHFTPKHGLLLLLVPVAFWLKVPYLVPIACGLLGTPVLILPISFGVITYFLVNYIKTYSTAITGTDTAGMVEAVMNFIQKLLQNKEMWLMVVAFALCLALVYTVHRLDVDYAWSIAIIGGAVVNVAVVAIGAIYFNVKVSFVVLLVGNIVSVLIALVLQFFFFSVDYSRTERLQYEDDEYVYYVKAVPKIIVAAPEKTVKRINERQETEKMDLEGDKQEHQVVKKVPKKKNNRNNHRREPNRRRVEQNTDEILLAQTLHKELTDTKAKWENEKNPTERR